MRSVSATTGRRTAFVTGGTGFVGTNLVHALASAGWRTVVLRRPTSDLRHLAGLPVEFAEGDVTDLASLRRAIPEGTDAVFHIAASISFWSRRDAEQTRVNVDGTRNAVAAARERGVKRFVHTSSIAAYGVHRNVIDEETPSTAERAPANYPRTKWLAEVEVRRGIDAGLDAVILNPANIVGPYDRHGWAKTFPAIARRQVPFLLPGRASWCHVREVVQAHIAAFERGRTGANYLLGGAEATFADFVRTIGEILGCAVPTHVLPPRVVRAMAVLAWIPARWASREPLITPEIMRIGCMDMVCSSDRAQRELGYRPVSLREMLEDCNRWLVAEGLLADGEHTAQDRTSTRT